MADYLFVSEAIAPLSQDETAVTAIGLARALIGLRHRVTILALAEPGQPQTVPGLARRLRKVSASVGGEAFELPLYEGRFSASDPTLYVLEHAAEGRGRVAALLASAAQSLAADGLLRVDAICGWGDTSATALARLAAPAKLFVLPTAEIGEHVDERESDELHLGVEGDRVSAQSLAAIGAVAAHVVVVPSPTAAQRLAAHADLAVRAKDEPLVPVRLGCDEPPNDPATDPALAVPFSAESLSGKGENRRQLARRLALSVGPRTLLLAVGPLRRSAGGAAILKTIARAVRSDVAVVVAPGGDRELADQVGILAIENPSRVALHPDGGPAAWRALLGAADAALFTDSQDLTARAPSVALRYGVLPLAPDAGAAGDYLVDYDPTSDTGSAILYPAVTEADVEAAIGRAAAMRAAPEAWARLQRATLLGAPSWARTAATIDSLRVAAEQEIEPAA
jgi:starch synthase